MAEIGTDSLVRRLVTTSGASLLGVIGGLGTGILTARILAPSDRGSLAIIVTTVTLSAVLAGLGTNMSIRVLLPGDPRGLLRTYLRVSALLTALQVGLVVGVLVVLESVGSIQLDVVSQLVAAVPLAILAFLVSQLLDALNALGRTGGSALTNAVGTWTTAALLIPVAVTHTGLVGVVIAYTLGYVARLVYGVLVLRRALLVSPPNGQQPAGGLLGTGIKLLGLNIGQTLTMRVDQFALAIFADARTLGLYSVAVTPASLVQVVTNTVGQIGMRDAATSVLQRRRLLALVALSLGASGLAAALLWITAPWLVPTIFGAVYTDAVPVLQVLAVAEMALAPFLLLSKVAAGRGRYWLASLSGGVGLAAMCVAMPFTVTTFGALGAAWTCCGGYLLMSTIAAIAVLTSWSAPLPEPTLGGDQVLTETELL